MENNITHFMGRNMRQDSLVRYFSKVLITGGKSYVEARVNAIRGVYTHTERVLIEEDSLGAVVAKTPLENLTTLVRI